MTSTVLDVDDVRIDSKTGLQKWWKHILGLVIGTVLFLLLIAIITVAIVRAVEDDTYEGPFSPVLNVSESELSRIDCYPEAIGGVEVANEENCLKRNCVWSPSEATNAVPACFVPQNSEFGFRNTSPPVDTLFGYQWQLEPINEFAIYGNNFETITFDIEFRKDHLLRFRFDVDGEDRFKVDDLIPLELGNSRAENPLYDVEVYQGEPFAFKVIRISTGTVIWDTGVGGLAFTNQFLQIATRLPSSNVYGFGENVHYQFKHNMEFISWPLWARDQPPSSGDESISYNLYSVHPFYECVEEDGNSHGVLLYNANAMDYTLTPLPMLVYKTIGGVLDFYIVMGPSPENVVQQYTEMVGRPYMPPYWMLGFQLSRYGYKNVSMMKDAVDRTIAYDIPLDVIYADIDHMYKNRIFTVDPENYGDLQSYFTDVREQGIKTVIILDPTVEINDTYSIYTNGVAQDIYVKWPDVDTMPTSDYEEYNRTDMMGSAWPEWKVVFPDFFHTDMEALWTQWLIDFRNNKVPFDALWLDMNEPANFDTNGWRPWNWPEDEVPVNWTLKCPNSTWDDPPYRTMASYMYDNPDGQKLERLSAKTLCMVGVHGNNKQYMHYDVHSLYGYFQTKTSLNSLRAAVKQATDGAPDLRSMVVTRSTYSGSAQHAGRWLGDNAATWKDLRLSIIGVLEFNILGFPYIGADICGFFNESPEQLCRRWHELGAFYPYSRNHNHEAAPPQDPGYLGDSVAIPTRDIMRIRYTLLPYLYTLFHNAHVYGNTVVRPLFHEFADDTRTYDIETQFLWGPALLIIPILEEAFEEDSTFSFYVPKGRWYSYYESTVQYEVEGEEVSFTFNIDTPIQLLIRGGHILPTQMYANNTANSRRNAFGLKVALDADDGEAMGELFWDDGETIDTYQAERYYYAQFIAANKTLRMQIEHNNGVGEIDELILNSVELMGVKSNSDNEDIYVLVNGANHTDFTFSSEHKLLNITELALPMNTDFVVEYRWSVGHPDGCDRAIELYD